MISSFKSFGKTLSILAGILLFSLNAFAWPFGNNENKPRFSERKIGSFNATRIVHFQNLVGKRQVLEEDISILKRVLSEQEAEWNSYGQKMKSEYGVSPDLLYTFSPTNLTVYLIITNGVPGASQKTPILRAHRAFSNKDQATKFLRLVSSRNLSDNRVKVLKSILDEKTASRSQILNELRTVYYVDPNKNYRFDAKTGDLFEVTQLPSEAQIKAAREAKKKADEEKEKKARAEKLAAEKKAKAEKLAAEKAEKARREAEKKAKADAKAKKKLEKKAKAGVEKLGK